MNLLKKRRAQKDFVGNKAKGRISKRVFQENKARQIFRKMNISNPLIRTRILCVRVRIRGLEMLVFRKIWRTLFFETPVLRFALLPYYRQF